MAVAHEILAGRRNLTLKGHETNTHIEQSHIEPILQRLKLNSKPSITANITFPVRLKAIGTFSWRIHQVFLSHGHPARILRSTLPCWSCLQCRAWMMSTSRNYKTWGKQHRNADKCLFELLIWRNVQFIVWNYGWIIHYTDNCKLTGVLAPQVFLWEEKKLMLLRPQDADCRKYHTSRRL